MIRFHRVVILHLVCSGFLLRRISSSEDDHSTRKRIAIIGDGVGGSFTSKYLADYDSECLLDITIYGIRDNENDQGSRVSSLTLDDGTVVELGASIIFEGNRLVSEMIDGDDTLKKVEPHSPGRHRETETERMNEGMGIYDGTNEENPWALLVANMAPDEVKKTLMWRYNLDLYKINKATQDALSSFDQIYDILDSMDEGTFSLTSPNDVWRATGLAYAANVSFDDLLDHLGVASSIPWWRSEYIFGPQGLVRDELYTAINQCNNNQNNSQMTGLAGLVNSAASTGGLFAIDGGNDKIASSAIKQAQRKHKEVCSGSGSGSGKESLKFVPKKIKTIVSDFEKGMELFDDKGKLLDTYDIVVLAAPLQFSGISFLGKGSLFDSNVLHPLSLNGMVENTDGSDGLSSNGNGGDGDADANSHGHRNAWGGHLPSSATRAYTKVVTTVVTNGTINTTHFSLDENNIPRSIYFTEEGKKNQMGISAITQLIGGVYKIFSSNELTKEQVTIILGNRARIEHVKVWDKGATPAFNGGKEASYATDFLLYDGGHGSGSFLEKSSALYYVNAMEAAVSAMEISAIGSKFVSKLIAKRLGLITPTTQNESDEL